MMTATTIALWIVRLTGMTQVALGLLFWTGRALGLLPLHMAIGAIFVLALLTLVGLAGWAGLRPALVSLAAGYGLVTPVFGMMQSRLLPGSGHWIVELLHLLIGIGGMILAIRLARYVREHPRAPRQGRGLSSASPVHSSFPNDQYS
jgi:hypothetical protein